MNSHASIETGQSWTLRPAGAHEFVTVRNLVTACELLDADFETLAVESFAVAELDNEVVGTAGVEVRGAHGLVRSVAVLPWARGRGIAHALVTDRIAWARERGIDSFYLLTLTAERYFSQRGFVTVPRSQAPVDIQGAYEFSLCPDSAVLMRYAPGESHAGGCCDEGCGCQSADGTVDPEASSQCCSGDCACNEPRPDVAQPGDGEALRAQVRDHYARAARAAQSPARAKAGCCGGSTGCGDPITSNLYEADQTGALPEAAVRASLGCGNPTLLAELRAGETVLDLGSGGGIDVLLSAARVGPEGFVFGLDMTDDMLSLARANQDRAGVRNVTFLKGEIEAIPLPRHSVDVIISNCVINLSADKARVLAEAFRVLKPGGRFAVSDIVVRKPMPAAMRRSAELWSGCVAGALEEQTYRDLLAASGFTDIEIVPTRIYSGDDAVALAAGIELTAADLATLDGAFMSAFVRARKAG